MAGPGVADESADDDRVDQGEESVDDGGAPFGADGDDVEAAAGLAASDHTTWLIPVTVFDNISAPTIDNAIAYGCRHAYPTITPAEWNKYFPNFTYHPPCR